MMGMRPPGLAAVARAAVVAAAEQISTSIPVLARPADMPGDMKYPNKKTCLPILSL